MPDLRQALAGAKDATAGQALAEIGADLNSALQKPVARADAEMKTAVEAGKLDQAAGDATEIDAKNAVSAAVNAAYDAVTSLGEKNPGSQQEIVTAMQALGQWPSTLSANIGQAIGDTVTLVANGILGTVADAGAVVDQMFAPSRAIAKILPPVKA